MRRACSEPKTLLLCAGFFLALFLQFPVRGELPGNTDSLLAIALSNLSWERLILFLRGVPTFTSLFPAANPLAYGENCYGLAALYLFFRLPLGSDLWAYYLFISALFTLNAYGISVLARQFVEKRLSAILAGFVFSLAGFVLANIDDPNVVFVFFPAMALAFLDQGIREKNRKKIGHAFLLSGIQIWFGFYVFLFQSLALLLWSLVRARELKKIFKRYPIELASCALRFLAPAAPLIALYLSNHSSGVFSPYDNPYSLKASSLSWYHFGNVLPNNLLYSDSGNRYEYFEASRWYALRKICFTGFALPLVSAAGLLSSPKKNLPLLVVFGAFFALAFGSHLPGFNRLIALPLGSYFRVASRFLLFAWLVAAIGFGQGTERLAAWINARKAAVIVPVLAFLIFALENVPFPLPGFNYSGLMTPPPAYTRFFAGKPERSVVLDLPSTYQGRLPDNVPVWSYSRDILYMNWQTYHGQKIAGGVNSYLPYSRVHIQDRIDQLPLEAALAWIQDQGVQFIAFHKKLILVPEERILEGLKKLSGLALRHEDDQLALFEVVK